MSLAIKIPADKKLKLDDYDPNDTVGIDKDVGRERFAELAVELGEIQEELFAAAQHSVLIILQGMDTSGKDGTIRSVLQQVNPQGCRVESFKAPTPEELAHDFLWRVHNVTPPKGMLGVFNRSHYEDVLVVRVHELVSKDVWAARYAQINHFESLLAANQTIVLKFFLHISKDEQEQRLREREQQATKAWKLSAGDWREREHWHEYMAAYEDALRRCSTDVAPWHIVPANKKWYRNLAISETVVKTLRHYRSEWRTTLDAMSKARLRELEEFHRQR
ncbi:MAG: polyphosphate kinase 2 family protein [Gammaproteobacteria bacterium]|nr:polyphosphate kinase 2 family protein [Gammaproteobacteria bacterium]